MATRKINYLSVEQQAQIATYRQKWEKTIFSINRIARHNVEKIIVNLYAHNNKPVPQIVFFASPDQALNFLFDQQNIQILSSLMRELDKLAVQIFDNGLMHKGETPLSGMFLESLSYNLQKQELCSSIGKPIAMDIIRGLRINLIDSILFQLEENLWGLESQFSNQKWKLDFLISQQLEENLSERICPQIQIGFNKILASSNWRDISIVIDSVTGDLSWREELQDCLKNIYFNRLNTSIYARQELEGISFIDFCISVLKCECDLNLWNMYQTLFQECDWIFPFENICLICDRPTKISFSVRHRLGKDAEPIMQFSDGFKVFE